MVGEVAAGVVTEAPPASLLGNVMAARPLRGCEGEETQGGFSLHGKHALVMQLGS